MKNQKQVKATRPSIASNPNDSFASKLALFMFRFAVRFVTRLVFLPFYAMLAAPWLFILFTSDNKSVIDGAFKIVSFLAGKPNAESLDAGDIGTAVLLVFVLIDVALELGATLRGEIGEKSEGLTNKTRIKVQCLIALLGWGIFAFTIFPELGWEGSVIAIVLGIGSCFFFLMEYSFREVWDRVIKGTTVKTTIR